MPTLHRYRVRGTACWFTNIPSSGEHSGDQDQAALLRAANVKDAENGALERLKVVNAFVDCWWKSATITQRIAAAEAQ